MNYWLMQVVNGGVCAKDTNLISCYDLGQIPITRSQSPRVPYDVSAQR